MLVADTRDGQFASARQAAGELVETQCEPDFPNRW